MIHAMELPPESDQEEAEQLVRQHPVELPSYRLERVHVATLNVDYAPPYGDGGYARPLSEYRLRQLRRDWDPLAVAPLVVSRRPDGLYVVDGNHRRFIAYEKGMHQLPAMVHSGLTRQREADLYTKLGTVLGQTPWTRFQSKLASGDPAALDIVKIATRHGLEVNAGAAKTNGRIMAIGRVEWIYARGGPDGLNWTLGFLAAAFDGLAESLSELAMEGAFMFYVRYADRISRSAVADIMGPPGYYAWESRADSLFDRVDVGRRGNTFGLAIQDYINEVWGKQGKKSRELLPKWEFGIGKFGSRYRDVDYRNRGPLTQWRTSQGTRNSAPQQLG